MFDVLTENQTTVHTNSIKVKKIYHHLETGMADEDQAHLERIFKRFDTNGDGKISSSELGEALKTLGSVSPDEVQRMMNEIDTDGDGYISYDEYMEFCNANMGLMRDVAKIV